MFTENRCPLCNCGANTQKFGPSTREFQLVIECNVCGKYILTQNALGELNKNEINKVQLSHLLAEMNLKKMSPITITGQNEDEGNFEAPRKINDILRDYPKFIPERMDRALCNIARLFSDNLSTDVKISNNMSVKNYLQIFAKDCKEFPQIIEYLQDLQYITYHKTYESLYYDITITPKGWGYFSNLEKKAKKSNYAFIAMWFDDSTKLFATQAHEAIEKVGYECKIVNKVHHNNYIMDEVINLINESRFIIADFTCIPECVNNGQISGGVRGGVYYEAGFAKGLGKDVIVTCRDDDDSQKRRHFDINQLNTIFWKQDNNKLKVGDFDFIDFLCERIKATVGAGANIK